MDVKTYRARTMQEALALVRDELGPRASVLRTREVRSGGLLRWAGTSREIEVVASASISVPSRLPQRACEPAPAGELSTGQTAARIARPVEKLLRPVQRDLAGLDLQCPPDEVQSVASAPVGSGRRSGQAQWPPAVLCLFQELIAAELPENVARDLVENVFRQATREELADPDRLKARLVRMGESELSIAGPIRTVQGQRRLVAFVGPTGVGKTTTIAKLAAHFRLRQRRRVGLITVDTYRIAAAEQLRAYADILEVPMEIVATPGEMCQALKRMEDRDLVLMDTAGRSPRDQAKLDELKSLMGEASPDEIHLVLSCVASPACMAQACERFATVGATALLLTKFDEAATRGHLWASLRTSRLPLSYVTHGQSVPEDIAPADARQLAQQLLS